MTGSKRRWFDPDYCQSRCPVCTRARKGNRLARLVQRIEMIVTFGGCPWGRARQRRYGVRPDELIEALEEQKQRFVEKFGREPGPDDHLFFDAPPVEHLEHYLVQAMKQVGVDPAVIFAFEQTGLLVTQENQHLISDRDRAEWEAAVLEYRIGHDDRPEEDTENDWF